EISTGGAYHAITLFIPARSGMEMSSGLLRLALQVFWLMVTSACIIFLFYVVIKNSLIIRSALYQCLKGINITAFFLSIHPRFSCNAISFIKCRYISGVILFSSVSI